MVQGKEEFSQCIVRTAGLPGLSMALGFQMNNRTIDQVIVVLILFLIGWLRLNLHESWTVTLIIAVGLPAVWLILNLGSRGA